MEHEFWHEKWQANELGFHQDSTHPLLIEHWPGLGLHANSPVLVPLCGKSKDMLWLRGQGHPVIGNELSAIACDAFVAENALSANTAADPPFTRYDADGITLLCGDFFALTKTRVGLFTAVYDRAALIALPEPRRREYVNHLRALCDARTEIFLITIDYPEGGINPPPFKVAPAEVERLYLPWCTHDIIGGGPTTVKGVPAMETVHRLTVK